MTKTEIIQQFTEMFSDSAYHLPIRWDGRDFYMTLYTFLKKYREDVEKRFGDNPQLCAGVAEICKGLYLAIHCSFKGNLGGAYDRVSDVLNLLKEKNSLFDDAKEVIGEEKLFRVVDAGDTASHDRKRIFHVPFSMRTKMSTNRYSVPGYPSLYLGTGLELCAREAHCYPPTETTIAARFEMDLPVFEDPYPYRYYYHPSRFEIFDNDFCKIIDLSEKPADAVRKVKKHPSKASAEIFVPEYILLYPLIAAGSFVRAKRGDSYSPEYIIPQLVTEWLCRNDERSVTGIKYFSCASEEASQLGANYVFPSNGVAFGVRETTKDYCAKLAHRFTLTNPVHINDYKSLADCEEALKADEGLDFIEDWKEIEKANEEIIEYKIPDGVLEISDGAFAGCKNLAKVEIPDSVTKIGDWAFSDCMALKEITIPAGVTKIGAGAFLRCSTLPSITIPAGVTEIGRLAFTDCMALKEITIPKSVRRIGNWAFERCTALKEITIPDSVTEIDGRAFCGCTALEKITIPASVTEIGDSAFWRCNALESITILAGVTKIGNDAFFGCSALPSITIPASVTKIGDEAFWGCRALKSITIPASVTEIGGRAFLGCSALKSITIPASVTKIGGRAFEECDSLTIYCEAEEKPAGWHKNWNPDNRPVVWGYKDKGVEA